MKSAYRVAVVRDTFRELRNGKRAVYRTWDVLNDDVRLLSQV